jgi:hypothetical protein
MKGDEVDRERGFQDIRRGKRRSVRRRLYQGWACTFSMIVYVEYSALKR